MEAAIEIASLSNGGGEETALGWLKRMLDPGPWFGIFWSDMTSFLLWSHKGSSRLAWTSAWIFGSIGAES